MSSRSLGLSSALAAYLCRDGMREAPVLRRLRAATLRLPMAMMQIAPEQGQLMALLARLIGAKRVIEIGTFTGYSALAVALALPKSGKLVALDTSREWTDIARRYWRKAGVARRIELRLGPAIASLDRLIAEGGTGRYDFAFIDADKEEYPAYYERLLRLVRPGGLIAVDNVLWSGRVADRRVHDPVTRAIRRFNRRLRDDPRIDLCLVPIGDGLTLARRR